MKIGMALPSMVPGATRDQLLAWMRAIDDGPFSVLGAGERVAYPNQDMMSLLAGAATVTDRVAIEATVSVTPMHAAVHVAKQAATIDVLSGGRFVLGVGVGGRNADYRAMGSSFARRHARLDEQVAIIRRVWAGEPPLPGVDPVGPAPVRPGGPPIFAAAMGPRSMARAARWADGLAGFDLGPDAAGISRAFAAFGAAWAAVGRTGRPFLQTSFWFGLGPDAGDRVGEYAYRYLRIFGEEAARAMASGCSATSPGPINEALDRIEAAGGDEVILVATTADVAEVRRAADLIACR
jgi:alkanesulfonate monooxygenase SsuD/methylene tetrahydromethanopterin reductase-like flavin-dependent oxidoreductase (luciferase family)